MPKRNRKKQKKLHFSEAEQILIGLEKVYKSGSPDARAAHSLAEWWLEHQSWTTKQWMYAKALVARSKRKKTKRKTQKKYYLYAITDGQFIKLGYSSCVKSRLKAMQTGHPKPLKCLWKHYSGALELDAKSLEKKLHRYCDKHRVRGEWFSMACAPMVESFSVNNEKVNQEINEELDWKLLESSPLTTD